MIDLLIFLASGPKTIDRLRECKRFLSCVLYCHWRPLKLSFRRARSLTTGSVYFVFHCNNQLLLDFSIIGAGNHSLASRPNESFLGARAAKFDSSMTSMVPCGDTVGTVPKVLPEKQCGTERVMPERLARPISQACTRIAWQPAVPVLVSSRAHLQQMLKNLVQAGPRAPAHEVLTRKT